MKRDWEQIKKNIFNALMTAIRSEQRREIVTVDEWDGSEANYETADDYCSACLIDVNPEGEERTKALCKLPVRRPGDDANVYVDKAIYAAAGGRGITQVEKPDGVSDEQWAMAVQDAAAKIVSAYQAMDETAPEAVYDLAEMEYPEERSVSAAAVMEQAFYALTEYAEEQGKDEYTYWLHDLFFDENGSPFVVFSGEGKLYRAEILFTDGEPELGDPREVVIDFPDKQAMSRSTIQRQADGRYRWFAISCSAVLNRVGSFDTRELFDDFVANFQVREQVVTRQFFHQGEAFRTGVMDYVARDGNLLITSGVYDDTEIARAEVAARMKDPNYWGDSIGFMAESPEYVDVSDGIKLPAYRRGYLTEVSTLPENLAAAIYTRQSVMEVNRMLTGKAFEAFAQLMGDEEKARKWLEEHADETNRAIENQGLLTRQAETVEEPDAQPTEPAQAEPITETEIVLGEQEIRELAGMVREQIGLDDMMSGFEAIAGQVQRVETYQHELLDMIAKMQGQIDLLQRSDDEKRAQWEEDLPPARQLRLTYRPTQPNATPPAQADDEPQEERGNAALSALPAYPFIKS
jgi:hypothetical protein